MFVDYHIHTAYSDDSVYPMEQVVRDAISLGVAELCFTDHVDYGIKRDWDDPRGFHFRQGEPWEAERIPLINVEYPRYVQEIAALRERYASQIAIKLGLEFGIQTHTIGQYADLVARYPFDFIILSIHQVGDREFWSQAFQRGKSQREYNMAYYEELLAVMERYHDYSVLGHLDMIARYDLAGVYPFEKLKPILTEILKTAIADEKGIEVNTSCFRYGLPDLTPSREILGLYQSLGGEILTIGSDTHRPNHLAARIPQTLQELKVMGFRYICTYDRMQPVFHPL